jgi:hypothetical protein
MPDNVRIACGSAGAIDRVQLAVDMVEQGDPRYLCLDSLAERTLALAQLRKSAGIGAGYDLRLPAYARNLFPLAREHGTTVIGNMGAADPEAALQYLSEVAKDFGLVGLNVALIQGDDVLQALEKLDPILLETGKRLSALTDRIVSANAYTGCEPIVDALEAGAQLVIGGRIADSSLFLAPLVREFGWKLDDWERLGAGTCVGHLLECGTYLTGGNFADPPYTHVEGFHHPSLPLADVEDSGAAVFRKLPGSDGALNALTCKLQLGYEVHNPSAHKTPDVVADFSRVEVDEVDGGVGVRFAGGSQRPDQLKVGVGVAGGFIGENQVSYAGFGALSRAHLAEEILHERLSLLAESEKIEEWRVDLVGVNAIHGPQSKFRDESEPYEVHVRGAARCGDRHAAELVAAEVEYLMLFGPSGVAAGHRTRIAEIVSTYTAFIDRSDVTPVVSMATL